MGALLQFRVTHRLSDAADPPAPISLRAASQNPTVRLPPRRLPLQLIGNLHLIGQCA